MPDVIVLQFERRKFDQPLQQLRLLYAAQGIHSVHMASSTTVSVKHWDKEQRVKCRRDAVRRMNVDQQIRRPPQTLIVVMMGRIYLESDRWNLMYGKKVFDRQSDFFKLYRRGCTVLGCCVWISSEASSLPLTLISRQFDDLPKIYPVAYGLERRRFLINMGVIIWW